MCTGFVKFAWVFIATSLSVQLVYLEELAEALPADT